MDCLLPLSWRLRRRAARPRGCRPSARSSSTTAPGRATSCRTATPSRSRSAMAATCTRFLVGIRSRSRTTRATCPMCHLVPHGPIPAPSCTTTTRSSAHTRSDETTGPATGPDGSATHRATQPCTNSGSHPGDTAGSARHHPANAAATCQRSPLHRRRGIRDHERHDRQHQQRHGRCDDD